MQAWCISRFFVFFFKRADSLLHNDFHIFTRHLQTSYSINNYYNGRTKRKQQWKHKSYYRKTIPQKKENAGRYMFPLKTICCFCRRLLEPEWNTVIANWRRSTVQSISINTIFIPKLCWFHPYQESNKVTSTYGSTSSGSLMFPEWIYCISSFHVCKTSRWLSGKIKCWSNQDSDTKNTHLVTKGNP